MNTKTLTKRSWVPFIDIATGKWHTGYEGYRRGVSTEDIPHEVRTLTITPTATYKDMSFEDKDGFTYRMTLEGGLKLIKMMLRGEQVSVDGIYLTCDFVQVKRGANLFIEVAEYD